MPRLTATGFALLAQIARAPISAYELTVLMRRNLHYLWPRAESRIYSEVTRLEENGLIRGRDERVGRRVRRIMSVTPSGRRALADWISGEVVAGVPLESEAVLRVFFATLGTVADLQRALHQVRADAEELRQVARDIGAAYLDGHGTAQEQAHTRAMIHELLSDYALLLLKWSDRQLKEAADWTGMEGETKAAAAMRRFEATMKRLDRRTLQTSPRNAGRN